MNAVDKLPLCDPSPAARIVIGAALALGFGAVAYLGAANWSSWFPQAKFEAAAAVECDPSRGPCSASFGPDASISLAMAPHPLRAAQPIRLSVQGTGLATREARVSFSGVEMNMGLTEVRLDALGTDHFEGVATLPLCISRRMDWRARVSLSAADGIYHADFRFETIRH